MKNKNSTIALTTVLLLTLTPLGFAGSDRVVPPWERGEKRATRAAIDTRPGARIPAGLRRAPVEEEPVAAERAESVTRSNGNLDRRIAADARRMKSLSGAEVGDCWACATGVAASRTTRIKSAETLVRIFMKNPLMDGY